MPTPPQKVSKKSEILADKFYKWSDKISQINFINGQSYKTYITFIICLNT